MVWWKTCGAQQGNIKSGGMIGCVHEAEGGNTTVKVDLTECDGRRADKWNARTCWRVSCVSLSLLYLTRYSSPFVLFPLSSHRFFLLSWLVVILLFSLLFVIYSSQSSLVFPFSFICWTFFSLLLIFFVFVSFPCLFLLYIHIRCRLTSCSSLLRLFLRVPSFVHNALPSASFFPVS